MFNSCNSCWYLLLSASFNFIFICLAFEYMVMLLAIYLFQNVGYIYNFGKLNRFFFFADRSSVFKGYVKK